MATTAYALTYDNLTSSVLQYLERDDPAVVDFVPTAIMLAEFEIAQDIKTLGQMIVAGANMTSGNPVIAKPALWRKTVSMTLTDAAGQKQPSRSEGSSPRHRRETQKSQTSDRHALFPGEAISRPTPTPLFTQPHRPPLHPHEYGQGCGG